MSIEGAFDPRFARVRDTLAEILAAPNELGAAVSVVIDGRAVVDIWGGFADRARTRPWDRATLANVYSTTKGWTALCALRLVDQGKLDLDAPVTTYWPEFAAAGKANVPVRWLLSHRAGLPALREVLPPEALYDWGTMTAALAGEEAWWEPGTKHGYHAVTFGWLVGEIVRRVAGMTVGEYFRRELATPLGIDAHIGLGAEDDPRCAELRFRRPDASEPPSLVAYMLANPESLTARAFTNPPSLLVPTLTAMRAYRAAEIPSMNGHATAHAIATLYGSVARGELLSAPSVASAASEQSRGIDEVLRVETRFGLGFMLSLPGDEFGPNDASFGHPGAGGSVGFADPRAKLGFGFVPNFLGSSIKLDPRARRLVEATYACL